MFLLCAFIVGSTALLDPTAVQMQAAWTTQQAAQSTCATPADWGDCSSAVWRDGACAYTVVVGCVSPATCADLFAKVFVPPLEPDDPCIVSAGYVNATNTCALQFDATCQAKKYHERFNAVDGTYYGYTVATSGATRASAFSMVTLISFVVGEMMLFALMATVCFGLLRNDVGDD